MPRGVRKSMSSTHALWRQQSDAFLERQGIEIRRSSLLLQGFGHSGQAECDQPFMGWMRQH
jgi:hypothetical protein